MIAKLPVILQTESAECGLACLAMVSWYYGHKVDLNTLRRQYPVSLRGASLRSLTQIAAQLDLVSRPLKFDLDEIGQLRLPVILHWDMNHFVVLKAVTKRGVVVHDPARGVQHVPLRDASNHITGVALELMPSPSFSRKDERKKLPFSEFWLHSFGTGHALAQILALSALLELLVIASPLYTQLALDQVIALGDIDLLSVLALGFGIVAAIHVAATALRGSILLMVQNQLHYEIGARLFYHLLRLPLVFFEKRHIGDILSRFSSIEPIRNLIAEGLVTGCIDGVMAVATLTMIFVYSVKLGLIVSAVFATYALIRFALFRVFWRRSDAAIRAKAQQDSTFIESLRAIQSVKLFNHESQQESHWLNRYAEFVNASVQLGRLKIGYKAINDGLFAFENIISIYVAVQLVLANVLSVGMIFAFISYKRNFTDKASQLIEKIIEYRIIGLHLERIADIALTPLEAGIEHSGAFNRTVHGKIELRNVSFTYADTEPEILHNINLTVEPGRFITIMGPSGCGKTTLLKLMLGLLTPTGGDVLIDDVPLRQIGARGFREHVAAVMQEDQLLSGSLADNICFFDAAVDNERMIRCCQLACIHDEIMRMPMAYNTLIGDMGNTLSGGQKQRVLLARALYRKPRILFLDEGTAHLDIDMSRRISDNLSQLAVTRISIAHRPEAASGADAVLVLTGDRMIEVARQQAVNNDG
jgi:ATP-binding cassette subfamily B protein RaxB